MKFLTIMALGLGFAFTSLSVSATEVVCEKKFWAMDGETGDHFIQRQAFDAAEAYRSGAYQKWIDDATRAAKSLLVGMCKEKHTALRCNFGIKCRVEKAQESSAMKNLIETEKEDDRFDRANR